MLLSHPLIDSAEGRERERRGQSHRGAIQCMDVFVYLCVRCWCLHAARAVSRVRLRGMARGYTCGISRTKETRDMEGGREGKGVGEFSNIGSHVTFGM